MQNSSIMPKYKNIMLCKKCGFILGTRVGLQDVGGICTACINAQKKDTINFEERQKWLTEFINENKTHPDYDCAVAVSGGKDSTTIVRKLFENHGVKKALLINIADEFTRTQAGMHNLDNICKTYNCDLITYRIAPQTAIQEIKEDFLKALHPLKRLEDRLYKFPIEIAGRFGIKLLFFGENPAFEYGSSETLEIFHIASTDDLKIIYMGAIYPYSALQWYKLAVEIGFRDLDYYNEWQRQGNVENYSQIDSIGYIMHIWTKFIKFGFQRVSDIACRLVRDGAMSYDEAQQLIKDRDYICDPAAKKDFCRTIGITEAEFDETVDKHANKELLVKDANGTWRRRDLF